MSTLSVEALGRSRSDVLDSRGIQSRAADRGGLAWPTLKSWHSLLYDGRGPNTQVLENL